MYVPNLNANLSLLDKLSVSRPAMHVQSCQVQN